MAGPSGLYIHIPYCRKKCRYCDFVSRPYDGKNAEAYAGALCRELSRFSGTAITTVFIGGGTPSALSEGHTGTILSAIFSSFDCSLLKEFTVEGNPESLTPGYLSFLKERGVTRISMGVQSFNDRELDLLGRIHTSAQARNAFKAVRSAGFERANIDLMYGLPGQQRDAWKDTLKRAVDLYPDHVSLYPLTIEEGTPFSAAGVVTDDERAAEMYEWSMEFMGQCGYNHYEISNWALPGQECLHNLNYWHNGGYIGAGAAASSYYKGIRRKNTESIDDYIRIMREDGDPAVEYDPIDRDKYTSERIILGLRCREGVELSPETRRRYRQVIERFQLEGLLETEGSRIRLARRGLLIANRVMSEFTQNA